MKNKIFIAFENLLIVINCLSKSAKKTDCLQKSKTQNRIWILAGGGPSLSFGISGTSKAESGGTKTSEKVKFGNSDNDDMKSFDLGANILAGYQFKKGFLIAANYNIGLSNLAPGSDPDKGKLKSSYFGIKLGYVLNNAGSK